MREDTMKREFQFTRDEFLEIPTRDKYWSDDREPKSGDRYVFLTSDCDSIKKCIDNSRFYFFEISDVRGGEPIFTLKTGEII